MSSAIEDMMRHNFPARCSELGPGNTRNFVNDAIKRGRLLGFAKPQLLAYVALEFCFGADFSTNPAYPWAQEILAERTVASEPRMQRLRTKAIFWLAKLAAAEASSPAVRV